MYLKQIILLIVEFVILEPDIAAGFEIISTTTERGVNRDDKCQHEIFKILGNNLREQQNFWISFYNNSYELQNQKQMQQTRQEIGQLFNTKLEETNAEIAKKQKEVGEIVNKQNDFLHNFDKKVNNELKQVKEEMKKQKGLIEGVNDKLKDLLQFFEKKLEEVKFAEKQKELIEKVNDKLQHFDKIEDKLKQVKEEIGKITSNIRKVEERNNNLPKNCLEVLRRGNTVSGVYTIRPNSYSPSFEVRCDMDTRGGGWTYVLNRFDGSQDFYLDWQNYKNGFGNLNGEFWLGLEHLYQLTGSEDNHLLVELVDWDNKHFRAMYDVFRIGSEEEGYPIRVLDGYNGDAGDSLTHHKHMRFSTHDRDQDEDSSRHCAVYFHGAWWYRFCYHSNLAGTYFHTARIDGEGIVWYHLKNKDYTLKKAKMMIRPYHL